MAGPILVSGSQLALLIDVDPRQVRKLAERGLLIKDGRGQYVLDASIRRYCGHLRDMAAGRQGRSDSALDNIEEGAKLKKAQREVEEIRLLKLRGLLMPEADVREAWAVVLKAIRSVIMQWPNRALATLPHLTGEDVDALKIMTAGLLKHNSLAAAGEAGPHFEERRRRRDEEP